VSASMGGASGEGGDAVREGGLRAVPAPGFQPGERGANRRRTHRLLAGAAAVLAIAALAAGDRSATVAPTAAGARVDVAALARTVEAEQDHVTAVELAAWIRDRKPGLRVVDVRGAEDFAAFHLPTAENLSLTALTRAPIRPDETVVLYSEGGTHAAQGWFFLRARGIEHVYFLRGGLYEWMTEVVNPTLPTDASPAQRAEFARTAELSRYFGGMPRIGGSAAPTAVDDPAAELPRRGSDDGDGAAAAAVRRVRQRGC
jgi:rhodanese-related sulfurtransferase